MEQTGKKAGWCLEGIVCTSYIIINHRIPLNLNSDRIEGTQMKKMLKGGTMEKNKRIDTDIGMVKVQLCYGHFNIDAYSRCVADFKI
jgi:hypothetical protein